jgi:hypothetical protein
LFSGEERSESRRRREGGSGEYKRERGRNGRERKTPERVNEADIRESKAVHAPAPRVRHRTRTQRSAEERRVEVDEHRAAFK